VTAGGNGARLDLCLVCYPYCASRDTGRGLDRYAFELAKRLPLDTAGIVPRTLAQGHSKGSFSAGIRQLRLVVDLLRARADVYHAISPIGGATAALLGKSPLVVTIHDLLPFDLRGFDLSWKQAYVRMCIRIAVKRSAVLVVGHRSLKEALVSRFRAPAHRIHVVPYGVDHAHYFPRPVRRGAVKRVLYVGEVSRSKGVDTLLKAFASVRERVEGVELIVAGKRSRDQPMLERMGRELGGGQVAFRGYVPEAELPDLYASAELMVFPSRCGFGLTPLEAMACGTPVIAGNAFDAADSVADAGILADPEDAPALAGHIVRVLTEPGLRARLSGLAVARAREFSWEATAAGTAAAYRQAAGRPGGGSADRPPESGG
jgi:glycosyltransferase involved in cell wall biosynthesis